MNTTPVTSVVAYGETDSTRHRRYLLLIALQEPRRCPRHRQRSLCGFGRAHLRRLQACNEFVIGIIKKDWYRW